MPIVISRTTGEVLRAAPMTQEQTDLAWEFILRAYLEKHPEILQNETTHGAANTVGLKRDR